MKIKSIKLINNKVLGNLFLDFTDNGVICDTIIFAGENGTGKSTILNIIYEFTCMQPRFDKSSNEKREIIIQLSDTETEELFELEKRNQQNYLTGYDILNNEFTFRFDFSILNWNFLNVSYLTKDNNEHTIHGSYWSDKAGIILKSIFSDVEINFFPNEISAVTAKDIDLQDKINVKSTSNLATEITQLLIDVQALDDADFTKWARNNINQGVDPNYMDIRMRRFKNAFDFMFPSKKYKEIKNENNFKKVIFEENGAEIPIENLSSGEKQIVFRGSFLLKDQKNNIGSIVLIDEPEISLHPRWQLKILEFFKLLFKDTGGIQTSQIFVVTHSPFILHNENRYKDKIIILSKNENCEINILQDPEFYGWTENKMIEEAFNIKFDFNYDRPIIITEGKSDWKHLKAAFSSLKDNYPKLDFDFLEYEENIKMGDGELKKLSAYLSKLPHKNKIILMFDRDKEDIVKEFTDKDKNYKYLGNNVYSFPIPIPSHRTESPDVSIEFYYADEEIKREEVNGRRIFISNEFDKASGRHKTENLNCTDSKYRSEKITIIDCSVYNKENSNVALPKDDFACNILNNKDGFNNFDFSEFKKIFDVIGEILEL